MISSPEFSTVAALGAVFLFGVLCGCSLRDWQNERRARLLAERRQAEAIERIRNSPWMPWNRHPLGDPLYRFQAISDELAITCVILDSGALPPVQP